VNRFAERYGTLVVGALALAILAAAAVAPVALEMIDEVAYYGAAIAMTERASMVVENGWDQFQADALRAGFLTPGPNGLVPQYPPGAAILGAPLYALFGMRGLVLLNALAAGLTLFVVRGIARAAYEREDVALSAVLLLLLATFWTEYAFGVWPHALAGLFVALALWGFLRALRSDRAATRWALAAGLAAGVGILVRVDTVLILPALGAGAILFAARPVAVLAAGAAGVLPGAAALSAINAWKFGTWNPLSYGAETGGVTLAHHLPSLLAVVALAAFLAAFRAAPGRHRPLLLVAGALATVVAALVLPTLRDTTAAWGRGAAGLIFDAELLGGDSVTDIDGVRYFWNLPKKALGQSIPWIGALAALLVLPAVARARQATVVMAIALFVWGLPFLLTSWYGGWGINMRYFLPMLPVLAVLGAWVWHRFADTTGTGYSVLAIGAAYGLAIVAVVAAFGTGGFDGLQQNTSSWILAACAAAGLAGGAAMRRLPRAGIAVQLMMAIGIGMAAVLSAHDVRLDRTDRSRIAAATARYAELPAASLFYGRPEVASFQLTRPEGLVAVPMPDAVADAALIRAALEAGYRVFMDPVQLPRIVLEIPGINVTGAVYSTDIFIFVEVVLTPAPETGADGTTADPAAP
jgi:4-amino-4-deoxy-L-arabinose transferase-like glycosyltransferase